MLTMPAHKPNVLFLELGSSGHGGSFKSLKEHIEIMRHTMGRVIVVVVNDSIYKDDYKNLGCDVIKLQHSLYSNQSKFLGLYNKLFAIARRVNGLLALAINLLFERRFTQKICSIVKNNDISLLYLNDQPMRNFCGFSVSRKMHIPVVSHMRTLNTFGFMPSFARYALKCNVSFVAISQAVKREWAKVYVDPGKVTVVYNPVPINEKFDHVVKKYDVIYVGRLIEGKGLDTLLKAICVLRNKIDVKVAIVGDGVLFEKLEHDISVLKLESSVELLGYKKNIHEYIAASKVLVLPTQKEGFGRVIVEAMKLNVVVIANGVDGVKELVTHTETGFLYDNTVAQLQYFLLEVLSNDVGYSRIVDRAYGFANANFSATSYQEKMSTATSLIFC